MSSHSAQLSWHLGDGDFSANRYSRAHQWTFDGGLTVPGSPSPSVVPSPWSDPAAVDPEEAFVASISSCHLLWFLHLARVKGYVVTAYEDNAVGHLAKNENGKPAVARVELRPEVTFTAAKVPDQAAHDALHHAAHEACFIANSVKTEIVCAPTAVT
ncbi:MAG: OsmC family protein [Synoicihabitans sp.]